MKRRSFRLSSPEQVGHIARLLTQLAQAGKPIRVTVERWIKKRSLPQNRYYWSVIVALIAEDTGYTDQEAHEHLKGMFCPVRVVRLGSVEAEIRSTTLLSTVEMSEYCERCSAFAATELGLVIPLPGEAA